VDRTSRFEPSADAPAAWREMEQFGRAHLPGEAPACDPVAGLWAAERLYFACQAVVCRDLDTEEVRPRVLEPCPAPRNPSVDFAVDVCLRFLPEVMHLARRLAAGDPVNCVIRELAASWPLSAVGVDGVEFTSVDTFWGDATLRRLFVDRVIARQCTAALRLPEVADAVRAALGAHDELAPALAACLNSASPAS
jgi:hypothetical protein